MRFQPVKCNIMQVTRKRIGKINGYYAVGSDDGEKIRGSLSDFTSHCIYSKAEANIFLGSRVKLMRHLAISISVMDWLPDLSTFLLSVYQLCFFLSYLALSFF